MPYASYFATAYKTSTTANYLRSSSITSKKRKGDSVVSKDDIDDRLNKAPSGSGDSDPASISFNAGAHSSSASQDRSLGEEVATQYATSGQPTGKTIRSGKFPHIFPYCLEDESLATARSTLTDKFANLRHPLHCANSFDHANPGSNPKGLRQRHLITLTATMHRCLLQRDYVRAGRAWAMLLRAEDSGHSFDLRNNDRWGVGAEVLLQRWAHSLKSSGKAVGLMNNCGRNGEHLISTSLDSRGIEQTKDYYERLVLQYPYRKVSPKSTGPQDFYFAMFGLWIHAIKERHSLSMTKIEDDAQNLSEVKVDRLGKSDRPLISDPMLRQCRETKSICQDTLQHAHEIATHLQDLLISPPYSDNARFWELLGMVYLWVADLLLVTWSQRDSVDTNYEDDSPITQDPSTSRSLARKDSVSRVRSDAQVGRNRALADAHKAFENANRCCIGPT